MVDEKSSVENEEFNSSTINEMPQIYCAIVLYFNTTTDVSQIVGRLTKLEIGSIEITKDPETAENRLTIAQVNNERFWHLDEALMKMFSYVDKNIKLLNEIVVEHKGQVLIDIAFYQFGTYPSLEFDGENMRKIHFLNANISIDSY